MLDSINATRFVRRMTRGRTGPFLLEGEAASGKIVEVVAKFSSSQLPVAGLVREALGALLASDLGLPVPECYCISLSSDFVATVSATHPMESQALAAAVPIGFASAKLPPGFVAWMPTQSIPSSMRQSAAEIYAFDLLVQNPDRRPDNPNLQAKGDCFAIFDHELALITENVLCWRPPWEAGSLSTSGAPSGHVLYPELRKSQPSLDRLEATWGAISDARFAEYLASLPREWTATAEVEQTANQAICFLSALRDNIRPAMREILRTLA